MRRRGREGLLPEGRPFVESGLPDRARHGARSLRILTGRHADRLRKRRPPVRKKHVEEMVPAHEEERHRALLLQGLQNELRLSDPAHAAHDGDGGASSFSSSRSGPRPQGGEAGGLRGAADQRAVPNPRPRGASTGTSRPLRRRRSASSTVGRLKPPVTPTPMTSRRYAESSRRSLCSSPAAGPSDGASWNRARTPASTAARSCG